jgi:hypothetical protein
MTADTSAHRLTREEARRIAVRAQLLDAARPGDVVEVAEQLGAIKIDPTATITTAEHAVLWSRIGWAYEPGQLRKSVEQDRLLFEFDGHFHAASLLPAHLARMRARVFRERAATWMAANDRFRRDVLARLRAEGPMLAAQIPDTSQVAHHDEAGWYGPNQVPRMLDLLASLGEVGIVGREGVSACGTSASGSTQAFPSWMPRTRASCSSVGACRRPGSRARSRRGRLSARPVSRRSSRVGVEMAGRSGGTREPRRGSRRTGGDPESV